MSRMLLALCIVGSCLTFPGVAAAEEGVLTLQTSTTMHDVLNQYVGKRVALRLNGPDEIEGTVTAVGNQLVHVARLVGREFFDAVVRIDSITAVRMRTRDR